MTGSNKLALNIDDRELKKISSLDGEMNGETNGVGLWRYLRNL